MEKNIKGLQFSNTIANQNNRIPSGLSDCFSFGMTFGCRLHCPAFVDGKCSVPEENVDMINEEADDKEKTHLIKMYPEIKDLIK